MTHNWIISDLDGTLATVSDMRLEFIRKGQYDLFNESVHMAEPIEIVRNVLYMTKRCGFSIAILTARSESCREETKAWLKQHQIPFDRLHMRRFGDVRSDHIIKHEMYMTNFDKEFDKIRLVLEDRKESVQMWRSLGIPCFQVAEGRY